MKSCTISPREDAFWLKIVGVVLLLISISVVSAVVVLLAHFVTWPVVALMAIEVVYEMRKASNAAQKGMYAAFTREDFPSRIDDGQEPPPDRLFVLT